MFGRVRFPFNFSFFHFLWFSLVLFGSKLTAQEGSGYKMVSSSEKAIYESLIVNQSSQEIIWKNHFVNESIHQSQLKFIAEINPVAFDAVSKKSATCIGYKLITSSFEKRNNFQLSSNGNLNFKYLDANAGLPSYNVSAICFDNKNDL